MESLKVKMKESANELNYSKEEIKDISNKVIFREKNIASERYCLFKRT